VVSALLGVISLAGAFEGWLLRLLKGWERLLIGCAAVAAIHHDIKLSVASSLFLICAILFFRKTADLAAKSA
jgi:TRAP-type uncharacterized transport system fused permease subunit